jgi:hypothetical protein
MDDASNDYCSDCPNDENRHVNFRDDGARQTQQKAEDRADNAAPTTTAPKPSKTPRKERRVKDSTWPVF